MLPTLTQLKANDHCEQLATRARAAARIAALGCLLALSAVGVTRAAASDAVVGPHGKIAGQGYGQWLRNSWQLALSRPPDASACQSTRVNDTTVAMLLGGYSGKPEHHSCSLRPDEAVYVNGLSSECSTVEKPPFHGTTANELRRCARRNLAGATDLTATLDGRNVRDYQALVGASPVYRFHLPKRNLLGVKAHSGRSAAYGEGLLLTGLTAGTHFLHVTGKLPAAGFTYDVTYTLHVAH